MKHFSSHHIIPKSRQKEFEQNLFTNSNIVRLSNKIHQDLHRLFFNKTPQEQIEMMYKINKKVLSDTSKSLLELLVNMDKNEFYSLN